jgi:hydroxyethylthiazole kinase-like uncharacterized protein yjeF
MVFRNFMTDFDASDLKKLYKPASASHKGQNGKLMIIGGSKLFHAASLWSLKVASRIVDMVFYSSVPENNEIVQKAKEEFRNGIIIPRTKINNYIAEADCILIGPGLPREDGEEDGDGSTKLLTEELLREYPEKKWVIDGGSLQTIDPSLIPQGTILTPHKKEFESIKFRIQNSEFRIQLESLKLEEQVKVFAKHYSCIVLIKGETDFVSNGEELVKISGGNPGMTKGGTGDVLAGLTAALYCKNEPFLSACSASYINKKAGESLYEKVGLYFNSTDLVDEIPKVMKKLLG